MYQRIDLTKTGGFPITQDQLDFMQKSYRDAIAALAAGFGDLVILTGIADLGASWGDGWVVIGGELLPFVGGTKASNVIIQETTADELFEDTNTKTVYFTRKAVLASSGGNLFSTFRRIQIVNGDNIRIRTKKVALGNWNLQISTGGSLSKSITPNIPDLTKIIDVSIQIFSDDDGSGYTVTPFVKGYYVVNSLLPNQIDLYADSTTYNSIGYNNPSINRGYAYITYED